MYYRLTLSNGNYFQIIRVVPTQSGASLVAQQYKNPPVMQEMQETRVLSLCQKDLLEESMATHSSILAWRIPWTEERGGLRSIGSQRVRHD